MPSPRDLPSGPQSSDTLVPSDDLEERLLAEALPDPPRRAARIALAVVALTAVVALLVALLLVVPR